MRSLKRQLILRLLMVQGGILILSAAVMAWSGSALRLESTDNTIEIIARAVERDTGGALHLKPTVALTALRTTVPDLWFMIRDHEGQRLAEGAIPPEFEEIDGALNHIDQAWIDRTTEGPLQQQRARIRRVDTEAGSVQIMTGSETRAPVDIVGFHELLRFFQLVLLVLPVFVVTGGGILIATPIVVRGALAGLSKAAAQAEHIDIDRRGTRLDASVAPTEVASLIGAVNDALNRLDEGYERHQRFLADAAHELRTPVAILNTRIASLPHGEEKTRLAEDVTRLATLTEQLLDLQRLDRQADLFAPVDIVLMSRQVMLNMAPLGFAAGYEMAFQPGVDTAVIHGDELALTRALTNLVQNAIDHGGRRGTITIRVSAPATIEVSDEGDGIRPSERQQIFEPFRRLRPQGRGAGLGLHLVREIVQLHGGQVEAVDSSSGACLRMSF